MKAEIKVPAVGESISEATIGEWAKKSGEFVKRDEIILLLETDKASVEVVAPNDGVLQTQAKPGETVKIGSVVAYIDTEGVATAGMAQPTKQTDKPAAAAMPTTAPHAPAAAGSGSSTQSGTASAPMQMSPAVRRVVDEKGLDPNEIKGTGKDGRLTKADALGASSSGASPSGATPGGASAGVGRDVGGLGATAQSTAFPSPAGAGATARAKSEIPPLPTAKRTNAERGERRVALTTIRKRIAERLLMSHQTTATLTTFNEIDMSQVMALREKYKDKYKEKYGVSLGFMGFFVKAVVQALREVPGVNAFIDGSDLIYHDFVNVGVAVGTEKGLIVPVIRDADQLSVAEVELAIKHYALKARDGKISIDDLSGGTFTVSNGGVYGSLMSTPILNPPQSGILGMHKIEDRPVVVNGQVVVRPMMYAALSYDHRIVDGKEAVTFLVRVKEGIEDPTRLLLEI